MQQAADMAPLPGLRDRKKAQRRAQILRHAARLFGQNGIDATTMAELAEATQVSPPTLFNYFGTKDGILIAMIAEGSRKFRETDTAMDPRTDAGFATILTDMLGQVTARTLEIAGKRVWRYAEASVIRHPDTDLSREYSAINDQLVCSVVGFMATYDLRLRCRDDPDPAQLGRLFFDVWNAAFLELIRDPEATLDQHQAVLEARIKPLARQIFEDGFLAAPTLKQSC
ncbi:TetR/AcrR family transcriptional regulator [Paracoccus liaowanqingii]|uniref:TetR/AcrR family transcriptional regulator n=1 Tax=Paracoccus liaowanqingii TaxID=2560053 RepID=UPI001E31E0B1|nr:TetR/AcrR family transcriptional regulator [Paracoccus liaowanqingii]